MSTEDVVDDHSDLTTEELEQFGFAFQPFEPTEQSKSLPSWQAQFQLMQNILLYSNSVLSMTAGEQAGKSTFIDELVKFLPESVLCHTLEATPYLNPTTMREQIIQRFSFNSIGDAFDDEIAYFISQLMERNQHCLLIIDNADYLSKACLDMLFEYASKQDENAFFHVFLAGREPLALHLESVIENYARDLNYAFELPQMTYDEALLYLKDRLMQAGFIDDFPIAESVVREIHEQAGGNFAMLDSLAYEALVDALRQPKTPLPRMDLQAIRWPATALLALVVAVVAVKPLFVQREVEQVQRLALPEQKSVSPALVEHANNLSSNWQMPADRESVSENTHAKRVASVAMVKPSVVTSKIKRSSIKKRAHHKVAVKKKNKRALSSPSVEVQVKAIRASRKISRQHSVAVVDSLVHLPKSVRVSDQSRKGEYGVQLLAATNLYKLKSFIKRHQIKDARIVKKRVGEKTWYSLVVGRYQTRQKATLAMRRLPKHLRQHRPWVSHDSRGKVIHRIS